ncbi:MAG: galactosyltransferase-related protein [Synechococcaceae cyanobacterium]|nr:galactosyltransferase-related protein [Synechococcaceae cyanobacterium]
MREWLGVWLKDRWRYERALRSGEHGWLALRNRHDQLEPAPDGLGFDCRWTFTSDLHAARIQSSLARRVWRQALASAPIERAPQPPAAAEDPPQLSVVIGHRGLERLPLLLATLESVAAQTGIALECLVVEQDEPSRIGSALPSWVRHIPAPLSDPQAAYNRAHAFNVGAAAARAPVLLLHDNDMLIPREYGKRLLARLARGYDIINPKRFVFYLCCQDSEAVLAREIPLRDLRPAEIVQNLEAGGSFAIRRSTYAELGGMDEGFVGWGGEDNEFWDRCLTRPTWTWGYEPLLHLWHAPQPLKDQHANPNVERYRQRLQIPAEQRIRELREIRHRDR